MEGPFLSKDGLLRAIENSQHLFRLPNVVPVVPGSAMGLLVKIQCQLGRFFQLFFQIFVLKKK